MKALVYNAPEEMKLKNVAEPTRGEGEVLIKIKACGICGSDIEGYLGKSGRRTPPMVMGHEFSGRVVEVDKSSKFSTGDKVTVYPKLYCGECEYCQRGLTNICPQADFLGVLDRDGAMQEYLSVPEEYVVKAGKDISYTEISMVEPLAVAYRAVNKVAEKEIEKANYILVVGAGTIGLLILQLLNLKGTKKLIVSDLSNFRLGKAGDLGASFVINPGESDFRKTLEEITGGDMVDYSFEAVGVSASATQSLNALKIGGTSVWVGNAQKMISVNMQNIVTTELNIKGNYIYDKNDFIESLELIEKGKINMKPLVSGEEELIKGAEMFEKLAANTDGEILKIILTD
ncbi:MAG: zinc-dependent alcohol dehydrogenase [Halanaerobiales bacterium]